MSWVLGLVWTVTNILFIAYHVIYSLPAKTKRNMQRETMKMVANQKNPLEIPDFKPLEGEVEEEFEKRRTTVRFGGDEDENQGWSSEPSFAADALTSNRVMDRRTRTDGRSRTVSFSDEYSFRDLRTVKSLVKAAKRCLIQHYVNLANSIQTKHLLKTTMM